ncbi:MAG TPA: ergothioneine biosynthesis protein EgtB [Burkholderiaceae bacterium]
MGKTMEIQLDSAALVTPQLLRRLHATRKRTVSLAKPLSEEDCCVQSMPDASPVKWHMAHTTWFFETFILERFEAGFKPFHPAFRVLFNSYYNGIGEKHPRPQRGLLTRPSTDEVVAYRHNVDTRLGKLLDGLMRDGSVEDSRSAAALVELGVQHEQQHQELILTDLKHLLAQNPLFPAYTPRTDGSAAHAAPLAWQHVDAGVVQIGFDGGGFCFDNELPRHRQFTEAFTLASRLTTNGEYAAFVAEGGYRDPALWLSEGWEWVRGNGLRHPIYWQRENDGARWQEFTLHGLQPLDMQAPLLHISYFEADAYARWAGARLPTEFEWEAAAAREPGLSQLYGTAWQWTSSSYAPYPGFTPADGAIGEYNGKFMVNQYVLRGSSLATPEGHARLSYRNFFPATARWQFSGIRLAK